MILMEEAVAAFQSNARGSSSKSNERLEIDDGDEKSMQQWKFDDLTSWIWLQNAIHPESEDDHGLSKESISRRIKPSEGINLKKWVKEKKQRRKEEERLQKAEVHAAVSIAELAAALAAALAAIAAENTEASETASLTETAVTSAAALVAAHCG
uniref:VAN3-binding protein-like auxin canalisation domain-containing protein n=1 Tax=Ananas comosus var. bracteatus TaxID=296719 RepID=A0A6V7P434_ANACO|nr:unnamed protein product [Ananas comosus var. bracteatus]